MSNIGVGPVYVVGNSRSGTTILSMGLGKHTDIFSFRELHFFEKYWTSDWVNNNDPERTALSIAEKLIGGQREGFLYCKNPEAYKEEAQQLLKNIKQSGNIKLEELYSVFLVSETHNNGKSIPCEQTPYNVFYIQKIFDIFPNARVIAMVRDPRDILLSQKNKSRITHTGKGKLPFKERARTWANYHPYIMSQMWHRVSKEIDRWKSDNRVLVVKFEDLVSNPQQIFESISEFIGIEFQAAMLDVPQIGSSNITDSSEKTGMNKEVLSKWKTGLSPAEVAICQKINKQKIHDYGYEWININSNYMSMSIMAVSLPVKAMLAVLLNIGRSKNIIRSIKNRLIG